MLRSMTITIMDKRGMVIIVIALTLVLIIIKTIIIFNKSNNTRQAQYSRYYNALIPNLVTYSIFIHMINTVIIKPFQ